MTDIKTKLILGTSESFDLSDAEQIKLFKKIGFDGFFINWKSGDDITEVKKAADENNMYFQSLHAPFSKMRSMWYEDENTKSAVDELIEGIDVCFIYGIPIMVVHAFIGFNDHAPTEEGLKNFQKVVSYAREKKIRIAFENTEGEEFLRALMEHFKDDEYVGFCLDTGHEMCYNRSKDLLEKYGDRLFATHLNDNLGIKSPDGEISWLDDLHLLPFDGKALWGDIARRLKKCSFNNCLTFELTRKSKPDRNENDKYKKMKIEDYLSEVFERAKKIKTLFESECSYSSHVFLFPFIWNDKKCSFFKYCNFVENSGWKNIDVVSNDNIIPYSIEEIKIEEKFQQMQYFTPSAQKIIFNMGSDYVKNYKFPFSQGFYELKKGELNYKLRLKSVNLKICNTGVGILYFEVINDTYCDIDSVKKINEYGRRIFPPYFADFKNKKQIPYIVADEITLTVDNKEYKTSFEKDFIIDKKFDVHYIPDFLKAFIPRCEKNKIFPAIDDRMFVCCCVNDIDYSSRVLKYDSDTVSEREGLNIAMDLYEFINIDLPGDCTCPTKEMLYYILNKNVYSRWGSKGSLYAVSNHSFMCLTTGKAVHINDNFLNLYVYMVVISLAQRSSIIYFDSLSSEISNPFANGRKKIKNKKLLMLQEKYIAFLNQYMNIEITCQEQGIELYDMMKESMFINTDNDKLQNQIERLYEAANVSQDGKFNKWATFFALFAIISQIVEACGGFSAFMKWFYPHWIEFMKLIAELL